MQCQRVILRFAIHFWLTKLSRAKSQIPNANCNFTTIIQINEGQSEQETQRQRMRERERESKRNKDLQSKTVDTRIPQLLSAQCDQLFEY